MATRAQAAAKKKELSGQISTLIRTLSLSVLAVAWLFLSGNESDLPLIREVSTSSMMYVASLCIMAIGLDLVQYIAGYRQVAKDYQEAKKSGSQVVTYSESSIRNFAFPAKIIFALFAASWLVGAMGWALFR